MQNSIKCRGIALGLLSILALLSSLSAQAMLSAAEQKTLQAALDARPAGADARDASRNPAKTLAFFGLQPGMKVAEVLPGKGWYTQVVAPYLGAGGAVYSINYADSMWPMFGFFSDKDIAKRKRDNNNFDKLVAAIPGTDGVLAAGYTFGKVPSELNGQLDGVLMIRALHNLNRFEKRAGTATQALADVYNVLKPGGFVGVVQHRAPATADDDWSMGQNGYLKQAAVVAMFEQAGFKLVASAEFNANPKDQPSGADFVWRLPPSLRTDEANKAAMAAIGESDRMTLKFIKPLAE